MRISRAPAWSSCCRRCPAADLEAVLFDLDNTLLLEDEATERAFLAAAEVAQARLGLDIARLARAAARAAEERFRSSPAYAYADAIGISAGEALWGGFQGEADGLRALRQWVPRFRVEVWELALEAIGIHADRTGPLPRELADAFVRARTAGQLEDPAAADVLDELAARYRLALVTNGASDVQHAKLGGTDLARWFEAIVVSADLGLGKPDPAPVRVALAALGVAAADAAMVGDSRERDIAAARAAGVYSVWLDRDGSDPGGPAPDARHHEPPRASRAARRAPVAARFASRLARTSSGARSRSVARTSPT